MSLRKSKFFGLVLLASMLQLSPAWTEEVANADGKVYVKNRAIRVMNKNIVVFTKDGSFTAKTLFSDENGVYVKANELEKVKVLGKKKFGVQKGHGCKFRKGQGWKKGNKNWKENRGKHQMRGWKKWKKRNGAKPLPAPIAAPAPAEIAPAPAVVAPAVAVDMPVTP